jgi:ABC-type transporter lipoprotein component MlaA
VWNDQAVAIIFDKVLQKRSKLIDLQLINAKWDLFNGDFVSLPQYLPNVVRSVNATIVDILLLINMHLLNCLYEIIYKLQVYFLFGLPMNW